MNDEIRAKSLIESGAPLREIAGCFSTSLDAYRYYAQAMREQFTPESASATSECACCRQTPDHQLRLINWRAVTHSKSTGATALLFLLLGGMTSRRVEVRFKTDHRYCAPCARKVWWSFALIRFAKSAFFALLMLGLFATIPFVIMTGVVLFSTHDGVLQVGLLAGAGLIFLFLIYLGFKWLWTSAVPAHLRFIARFPFEPLNIEKIDGSIVPPERSTNSSWLGA